MPLNIGKVDEIGLESYLDQTKSLHNNKGFNEFVAMIDDPTVPRSKIADEFGVTRPTVYDWLRHYVKIAGKEQT